MYYMAFLIKKCTYKVYKLWASKMLLYKCKYLHYYKKPINENINFIINLIVFN